MCRIERVRYEVISMADSSVRLIDLFSGAGGLTLGFCLAGEGLFRPVWANDFNELYRSGKSNHEELWGIRTMLQHASRCG